MRKLILVAALLLLASCGEHVEQGNNIDLTQQEQTKELNDKIDKLQAELNSLSDIQQEQTKELIDDLLLLQNRVIDLNMELISHLKELPIEFINPCGDSGFQYEEIILRIDDTTLVSYFETGNKRFLTRLIEGNFITTDQEMCNFIIKMVDGKLEIID